MTEAQEQGGAVQPAEGFTSKIFAGCECWLSAVPAVSERDAAIRRAAIEEHQSQVKPLVDWMIAHRGAWCTGEAGRDDCVPIHRYIDTLLAASTWAAGSTSERGDDCT